MGLAEEPEGEDEDVAQNARDGERDDIEQAEEETVPVGREGGREIWWWW